jgi:hypothetical protein
VIELGKGQRGGQVFVVRNFLSLLPNPIRLGKTNKLAGASCLLPSGGEGWEELEEWARPLY